MRFKKLFYILAALVFLYVFLFAVRVLPFVIDLSDSPSCEPGLPGDTVCLADFLDTNGGTWEMYVNYASDDLSAGNVLLQGKAWKSCDRQVIFAIMRKVKFTPSDADLATAGSEFYVLRDGKPVFRSHIVLDESQIGFQNRCFGWNANGQLKGYFRQFKRVYNPLVVFY